MPTWSIKLLVGKRQKNCCVDERDFRESWALIQVSYLTLATGEEIFSIADCIRWVSELPARLSGHGFEVLHVGSIKFNDGYVQLCTNTYFMAMAEVLRRVQ
jgi:hypothetical protein